MGHFFAVDCMIWWVTTTLTHWGQVYIEYGKGLLLVRFQAVTWNWYCHIHEIRTQWGEDHGIHCMYIYSWNWFLIVPNTAIKDFEFWFDLFVLQHCCGWSDRLCCSGTDADSHWLGSYKWWPTFSISRGNLRPREEVCYKCGYSY